MDQTNDAKPYGLSFESADVYAESLGIQIKDYELVSIISCINCSSTNTSSPEDIEQQRQETTNLNKKMISRFIANQSNLSHHVILLSGLIKIAKSEDIDYICSIKIFGVNNLVLRPDTVEKAHWMNTLTATGLRRKPEPKTKTTPPLPIKLPPATK